MSSPAQLGAQKPSLLEWIVNKIDDIVYGKPQVNQSAKVQSSTRDTYGRGPTNTRACVNGLQNVVGGNGSKQSRELKLKSDDQAVINYLKGISVRGV